MLTRKEILEMAHTTVQDILGEAGAAFEGPDAAEGFLIYVIAIAAGLEAYVKMCASPVVVRNTRALLDHLSSAFQEKLEKSLDIPDRPSTIILPTDEQRKE